MLDLSAKTFAVQIGSFRIETINNKAALMHIVPVVVFLIAAYVVTQILTGGTRRIRIRDKQMTIRRKSFRRRLAFLSIASLAGIVFAIIYPLVATLGVPGLIVETLLAILLLVIGLGAWFFVVNASVTIDLASPGGLIRGRRNIAMDYWKGVGIGQRKKSAGRELSSTVFDVCLVPTDKAVGLLGGPVLSASSGILAAFNKDTQAREAAAEVARFCGLPLLVLVPEVVQSGR